MSSILYIQQKEKIRIKRIFTFNYALRITHYALFLMYSLIIIAEFSAAFLAKTA